MCLQQLHDPRVRRLWLHFAQAVTSREAWGCAQYHVRPADQHPSG